MAFGPTIGDAATAFALIAPTGQRSIGPIFPNVAEEEIHHDEMTITRHPVQTGSPVTDHMFAEPVVVELRWYWSNSVAGAEGYVQAIYQQILALQKSRVPTDITTGKRQYQNMGIASVAVRTNPETEFALALIVIASEMIFASVTTSSSVAPNTNGSTLVGNVSDPASNATLSANNAAAAGLAVDPQGNVSFPNGVAPGGNFTVPGVTAPSFGQTASSIFSGSPALTSGGADNPLLGFSVTPGS